MCRFRIQKRVERKYRKEHFIFNLFPKDIFNCLLLSVFKTYFTYLIEFETKLTWSRYCHENVIFQWKHLNSSFVWLAQFDADWLNHVFKVLNAFQLFVLLFFICRIVTAFERLQVYLILLLLYVHVEILVPFFNRYVLLFTISRFVED